MLCHCSLLQASHFGLLSCLASDGRWRGAFSDLADSRELSDATKSFHVVFPAFLEQVDELQWKHAVPISSVSILPL